MHIRILILFIICSNNNILINFNYLHITLVFNFFNFKTKLYYIHNLLHKNIWSVFRLFTVIINLHFRGSCTISNDMIGII